MISDYCSIPLWRELSLEKYFSTSISVQTKVGTWNSLDKLNLARVEEASTGDGINHPMANKTFVIVGVLVTLSPISPSVILHS